MWKCQIGCVIADKLGFLSINEYLQAASGPPNIFAVGDVATSTIYPRPKAGVFAVRQGPPLADNIRRSAMLHDYCNQLHWQELKCDLHTKSCSLHCRCTYKLNSSAHILM